MPGAPPALSGTHTIAEKVQEAPSSTFKHLQDPSSASKTLKAPSRTFHASSVFNHRTSPS
eukprot:12634530-Alexandrium_andersonii.AAC.1